MERQMLRKLDQLQTRSAVFEALKHLVVGGNALLYIGPDFIRMYGLRSYCLQRDPEGNVTEIVVREQVNKKFVPGAKSTDEETVDVYTHVSVDPEQDRVSWYQEQGGKQITNSQGFSRLDNSPWLPLRWGRIAGEPIRSRHGRGRFE